MKTKTKNRIVIVAVIAAVVIVAGVIASSVSALTGVGKKRNPDNLIDLDSIEAVGITFGEQVRHAISHVRYEVSDQGVIKLMGTATADGFIRYAKLTLKPGVYRLTGAFEGSGKTYELYLVDAATNAAISGDLEPIVITEETEFYVGVMVHEGCEFARFGTKLYPVLWEIEDSSDKTVVEFWK